MKNNAKRCPKISTNDIPLDTRRHGWRMPQSLWGVALLGSGCQHGYKIPYSRRRQPQSQTKINHLELASYVVHLHIFFPKMSPLDHIYNIVDNTVEEGWEKRGRIISPTYIGHLLKEDAWLQRQVQIHVFFKFITGLDNKEANKASCLTHLPVCAFLKNFCFHFPQACVLETVPPNVCSQVMAEYYATHADVTKELSSSNIYKYTTAWHQW